VLSHGGGPILIALARIALIIAGIVLAIWACRPTSPGACGWGG
jgi:hypothetical protein